jgi:hypothetical protein
VLISRLARESAWLAIVQLTTGEEADPAVEGGRRLIDVEGRGEAELVIDEAAVRDYRARFMNLRLGPVACGTPGWRTIRSPGRRHATARDGAGARGSGCGGSRMIFATPLGLLALLAIPAIIAIHLFRRRFPERRVAGLFLWGPVRQTPEGGGRITRLPITRSLILECLAALALALILAGARISPAGVSQHLVVLLDDSASMAAVDAAGDSARDRAVRRILAELGGFRSGARITLIRSGDRPAILAAPASYIVEAKPALDAWKPVAPHHSMALAVRLARELAGRTGTLMVMSDMPPAPRGEPHFEGGVWVALGDPVENVGYHSGAAHQRPGQQPRRRVADTREQRRRGGEPTSQRTRRHCGSACPGTERAAWDFVVDRAIPAGLPAVRVSLSDDGLRRDDEVMLADPRARIVATENKLPEGRGRDALTRALEAVSGVTRAVSGHLAFVDRSRARSAVDHRRVARRIRTTPGVMDRPRCSERLHRPVRDRERHPLVLGVTHWGRRVDGCDARFTAGVRSAAHLVGAIQVLAWPRPGPGFCESNCDPASNIDLGRRTSSAARTGRF